MDTVLQTVQSVDQSVAGLTEQMAQLQAELSGLQTRSDTQDVDVQSLNEALQGLSSEVAVQAETAASQLQALTELWESADLGALLQAVQSVDQSVTGLLQQVAELQTGMEALQTRSDEQGLEVQALAAALQSLSSEVAGRAETTAAQLQALAEAIEAQTVAAAAPAQIAPLNVQPEPSGQSAQLEGVSVNEPAPGLQMIPEVVFKELVRRNMAMVMRIKANDTIWGIANRFQTPPSQQFINQIIEINKVDPYRLRIGQDLLIPLNDDIFRFIELE
jgi:LysM repeat protein